jgi:hypothetical protein
VLTVRTSALRQAIAVVLVVVLTFSGIGRTMATPDGPVRPAVEIAGVLVPLCHAGSDRPAVPAAPGHHDCCDVCALCAPVALLDAAPLTAPARVEHVAVHADALTWAPAIGRIPTPRLSQGPPAA